MMMAAYATPSGFMVGYGRLSIIMPPLWGLQIYKVEFHKQDALYLKA